jgi:hypothetical protein
MITFPGLFFYLRKQMKYFKTEEESNHDNGITSFR